MNFCHFELKKSQLILITLTVLFLLSGCTSQSSGFSNTSSPNQSIPAGLSSTKDGLAKVYFVSGKTGSTYGLKVDMAGGATFLVNGNDVGQISKNGAMVLDIKPGSYNFAWKYPSADAKLQFVSLQINANDITILQADYIFPLIGTAEYKLTRTSDFNVLSGKQITGGLLCPKTICP